MMILMMGVEYLLIRIYLSDMLGRKKMTRVALSRITGIRQGTISKMYHEEIKRIDIDHIEKLCKALDCSIGDLIEYVKDDVDKK